MESYHEILVDNLSCYPVECRLLFFRCSLYCLTIRLLVGPRCLHRNQLFEVEDTPLHSTPVDMGIWSPPPPRNCKKTFHVLEVSQFLPTFEKLGMGAPPPCPSLTN